MSISDLYPNALRGWEAQLTEVTETWFEGTKRLLDQAPGLGGSLGDSSDAVSQLFESAKRATEVNAQYVYNLMEVSAAFSGAVRDHLVGLIEVAMDGAKTVATVARDQVVKVEEASQSQAEEAERLARAESRRQRREARAAAAENYASMTKPELSEELERRNLPKSGNVDELRDRLIEADLSTALL